MNTNPYLHWRLGTDADNLTWLRFDKAALALVGGGMEAVALERSLKGLGNEFSL